MNSFLKRLLRRNHETHFSETRGIFDVWALDGREAQMERGHGPIARRVFDALHLAPDAHYLDIGCSNGYSVRWAAAAAPAGRAVGIDLSPQMIRRARELSAGIPGVAFHEAAFPRHDLPHSSFDAIFSMETLYYLPDIPTALAEIRTMLKPGGIFVSAIDFFRENRISRGWTSYVGANMKYWSGRRWRVAFERAGFTGVLQQRMTVPSEEAVERWHSTVGCLVTSGRRAFGA